MCCRCWGCYLHFLTHEPNSVWLMCVRTQHTLLHSSLAVQMLQPPARQPSSFHCGHHCPWSLPCMPWTGAVPT